MNYFISGALSGMGQSIVGHPFDTIKVFKQQNIKFNYKNLNIRMLYRGFKYPFFSNIILIGTQFHCYHNHGFLITGIMSGLLLTPIDYYKIQHQININKRNIKFQIPRGFGITITREIIGLKIYFDCFYYINEKINNSFIAGGISGVLSWLIPYPIDTIKTRIQSNNTLKKSILLGNFYNGLSFCLFRAFLVNGVGFYCANIIK
jgi:hypothetical protein